MSTAGSSGQAPRAVFTEQDLPAFRDHLHGCERCAHASTAITGCPDGYRIKWRLAPIDDVAELVLFAREAPTSTPSRPSRLLRYMVMLLADELPLLITHVEHHQGDGALEKATSAEVEQARDILTLTPSVLTPGTTEADRWAHARRLATSVVCLRERLPSLGDLGGEPLTFCWRCARLIQPGQPYSKYRIDSPTVATADVYIHDACASGTAMVPASIRH
ncbi:hypothetical protein [Streptomyces ipomoeae]|uniref:hypothetical protein n=1 Tax=Streptomyces ipomoeae TaxID=103232 RepID=UPI0011462A23|nr:hypothetical protein [Streptomyces ipomoeae]TQE35488.1 hypothetical protein Sipo7851_14605 [Streptomyces ipomoeae]